MSVLDPVIDHLDTADRLIYLGTGVRSIHPIDDIYHEVRNLRANDEVLQRYFNPVSGGGAVLKGGGKFTPRYAIFNNGWRIVPEDVSHTLDVTGEQLTSEGGSGPSCFDFTVLSPGVSVIVNYEPPAAEIVQLGGIDLILVRKLLQNRTHTDPVTGVMTVYDDDDITELVSANLYEDIDGTTPYGVGSQRIDRRGQAAIMIVTRGLGPGALLPTAGLGVFPSLAGLVFAKRDPLGVTDSLVLQQDWVRIETDTLNVLDVFVAQQHWIMILLDAIGVDDEFARQLIPLFVIRAGTMTLRNDAYVSLTLVDE